MKQIYSAGIFRRIVAAFLDAVVAIFVYFLLITFVATPILVKTTRYQQDALDIYQYEVSSHLYVWMQQADDSNYYPIEVKDFSEKIDSNRSQTIYEVRNVQSYTINELIEHAQYHYTVYLTGDLTRVQVPNDTETNKYNKTDFISPYWNIPVSGVLPKDLYTPEYFNVTLMGLGATQETNTSPYFNYPYVEDHYDLKGIPVLKDGLTEDQQTEARTAVAKVLYNATEKFYYTDYMQALQKDVKKIQLWGYIPSYLLTMGLFYLLIPMLAKNSGTFGKFTLGIAVISKTGYKAKKRQILFRQIVYIAELSLSLFIVGYGLTSFATLGIGCVIMLLVTLFTKEHRAPHDLAALTLVVDAKKSVYFDDAGQEDHYEKQVEENIEKLHSYEPENKNVIQVGSKIIDPQIEQEVKESKKKDKKQK